MTGAQWPPPNAATPPYGATPPGYGYPPGQPQPPPANPLSLASLGLGSFSLITTFCCCVPIANWVAFFLAPVLGVAAIGCGIAGLQASKPHGIGKNESIAGIALGSVSIVAALVGLLVVLAFGGLTILEGMAHPAR
jgi:hypothetical protein